MRTFGRLILAMALGAASTPTLADPPPGAAVPVLVSFSAQFEAQLRSNYGLDEGEVLRGVIIQALGSALGAPPADPMKRISVEVVLESAKPTHPTRLQLAREPGMDFLRSISLGGAELTATLRGANGRELAHVSHSYFAPTLEFASSAGEAWADARRSIQGFAAAVAAKIRAVG
jgi:hypothetical protein